MGNKICSSGSKKTHDFLDNSPSKKKKKGISQLRNEMTANDIIPQQKLIESDSMLGDMTNVLSSREQLVLQEQLEENQRKYDNESGFELLYYPEQQESYSISGEPFQNIGYNDLRNGEDG